MTREQIQHWLLARLAAALKLPPSSIDVDEPLARYGIDSAQVMALSGELERLLGRPLSPTLVFEYPTVAALAGHLSGAAGDRGAAEPAGPRAADGEPIAIIGLACRFPGAASPRAYWELVSGGRDAVREVPRERWNADDYYDADPAAPGKATTRWGGFLDGVDRFDPYFFGISPREALEMDPQQRLLLELTWEALEDAGAPAPSLARSRTGVFVGISHNEYGALVADEQRIGAQTGAGNALSIAANRVSYAFDFHGPSLAVDTACSSSLAATHLACRSLRSGESSLAIVAGANLLLSPALAIGFTKAGLMSPDGRCKAFDARANGYVRGEGVGVVVLKPLSRAEADGDAIYAVIRGSAMTQDGRSNGLMAPNPRAQEAVIRGACADARVDPSEIQYVEAHGTGTFLGDPIELRALGAVVSADRPAARPCIVGSVKSNIGHLEAAAGVASLIKVALMMRHGVIPPSLHFEQPNPGIPFDELRLRVSTRVEPWTGARLAGISSFGFGGTNVHVVVESAPVRAAAAAAEVSIDAPFVLPISARSDAALHALAGRYGEQVTAPGVVPAGLARAAARCRTHHAHRLAVVAASAAQARELLDAARTGKRSRNLVTLEGKPPAARRIAFVFSGQGTQWAGMGRQLADYPVARAVLERIDRELGKHAVWPASRSLLDELRADPSRLGETELAQPAIFAIQVALAELLRSWGIVPRAVVGHSVGEIAAAHVAGILSLGDAVRVVVHRAHLMQRATGHGAMASVALAEPAVQGMLAGEPGVSIAALNGETDTVIAGAPDAVARAVARLEAAGAAVRPLGVPYAFHTAQMDPFVPELIDALRGIEPAAAALPMFSTVTGGLIAPRFLHAEYWGRNMREPVAFHAAARALIAGGHDLILELGPHPALGRYLTGAVVCETLRRDEPAGITLGRALATAYVHGAAIDWQAAAPGAMPAADLPSYPWQHERFWPEPRPAASPRRGGEHPLLGTHLSLAGGDQVHAWQITPVAERVAYLRDHRVAGAPVLPAAAYFEVMMSAVAQIALDPGATAIDDVELHEMLALDESALPTFQTLARDHGGQRRIELHTRDAGGDWTRRASARLGAATAGAPPRTPIAEVRQRCFEPVPAAGLYRELAEHGLDYGPAFRGLVEVWRRAGEAIGRLELPEPLVADRAAYAVHPALLDACLHVIAPALPPARTDRERASVLVPVRAGRIRWLRRAPASVWSHVTVHPRSGDARALLGDDERADVRLLDDAGDTIAEITGLVLRRIALSRPAVAAAEPADGIWRYAVEWKAASPPARAADSGPGDRWLVFADQGGVGERVARALEQRGASCLVVERAGVRRSPASNERSIEVDPSSPDAMRAVIRDRLGPTATLRGVLHMWSLDAPPVDALDAASLAGAQALGVGSALDLVQALAFAGPAQPPRLWLVTRGAVHVAGAGGGIAQAPLWGLGKAIAFEQSELACTMVDLDPAIDPAGAADQLLDALARPDSENQIALRGAGRYVPRLAPAGLTGCPRRGVATDALSADATYVITGGLGALGLRVAGWLIDRGARNLVLLGRRGPAPEVAARLAELRQRARVVVEPVDVADPARLAAALDRARAALPPLRGVIHAAAVLDDGALLELSRDRLAAVLAPKLLGAWNLHALTAADPLDFFVLFSSAVSVLGSPGQASYTAANTFLDALAHHRRAADLPAVSINWGPWAEIGLAAETARRAQAEGELRAHLIQMILPERGLELLAQILLAAAPQITILPFDVRNVLQFYPEGAGISLFSDVLREDLQALTAEGGDQRLYARPAIAQDYVAPRNDVEQIIAGIWQRALTIDRVGVHDNFFELGGDSVFAGQIVSRINKTFGVKISLTDAFTSVTVAHLGELVQEHLMAKVEELSDEQVEHALRQGG